MTATRSQLVSALHSSGRQAVVVCTGGGSLAISDVLTVPGASAFLLDARVPYAPQALTEWLGSEPEQCCSRETALAMSMVAWLRARTWSANPGNAIGVALTASLVSNRPKRGAHRAFLATQTERATRLVCLTLAKGARVRLAEERFVADHLLHLLAMSCEVLPADEADPLDLSRVSGDEVVRVGGPADPLLVDLMAERRASVWAVPLTTCGKGTSPTVRIRWQTEPPQKPAGLLAGSFNPLHDGHRELAQRAEQRLGGMVAFELAWRNVDKPPLDFLTIEARCEQFTDRPVVLTHAPTFVLKSRLFPGTAFVVGVDTAERIVHPRYYGNDEAQMLAALDEIRAHGCRFLVAGRCQHGEFRTLTQVQVPPSAHDLFEEIPEVEFRRDISSTELRRKQS